MGLGAFEGSNESIGKRRGVKKRRGSWEAIKSDIETELKGSGLKRVRRTMRMRFETSAAEETN